MRGRKDEAESGVAFGLFVFTWLLFDFEFVCVYCSNSFCIRLQFRDNVCVSVALKSFDKFQILCFLYILQFCVHD